MGVFPENYEIPPSRIIKLWVAEGFLFPFPNKSLEEAARIQLNDLVNRNLIFVRTRRWNGKAKSYGVHDLLRNLCLRKAQEKKFLYVKDSRTDIREKDILGLRRVSVFPTNVNPETFYGSMKLTSFARSFLLGGSDQSNEFVSRLCYKSSLLRVLDVYHSPRCNFQEMFLQLVNLRYLAIESNILSVAKGISVLKNLQTLKVETLESLAILDHLPLLRHLQFFYLNDDANTSEISPHENLQSVSSVPLDDLTYLLEKIPNLRKLVLVDEDSLYDNVVDLTCFQKLESVSFRRSSLDLTLPRSLKRLILIYCKISQTLLNEIGILPGLEVLRLYECDFENQTWEPSKGEFLQLQHLQILKSKLENWSAADYHFPALRLLFLRDCSHLAVIPNDIGGIDTLETIDLDQCKASLFDSARTILEEQLEYGNTLLKLRLGRTYEDFDYEKALIELKSFERRVEDYELTISHKPFLSTKVIFPHYLKKLKLRRCKISRTTLSAMGVLLELQVLKLEVCDFEDSTWQPSEGEFCQLQHLEINDSYNLCTWLATEIHFPVLTHLVLQKCPCLIEIPVGIGRIQSLERIEVEECEPSLVSSARKILKEQCKLGNTLFQFFLDGAFMEEIEK